MALLKQKAALGNISVKQRNEVLVRSPCLRKSTASTCSGSTSRRSRSSSRCGRPLGSIESAFNSQLRGLLAGTTTWSQAFKKILGDLIIQFIEMCETMVVKWLAAQLAQTTATTTGAAARAAAEQSASSAGILATQRPP